MTVRTGFSRRTLLASGAALAMPYVAKAAPDSIVVATSGGKLAEAFTAAYYKPFTAKTGIQIVDATNTYSKLKAMVDANAVEWDVAQMDSSPAASNAKLGLLEKLDYNVIDKSSIIPGLAREHYLPCDVVAALIAWNTKNVTKEQVPQTWAELWDLKRFSGQRGFWKQPFQTLEIALMADGVPKDKLYPLDLERALKSLDKLKSQIFWWNSGAQSAQVLIDGDLAAGMAWNGRVYDPKLAGAPIDFHFNQALLVADSLVVPRGAKNKKASMDFIAFAMQPEQQAAFSAAIPYGPVNQKALPLVAKDRLAILPSSSGNLALGSFQNFDWWAENGAKVGDRFNEWMLS
jgi:putative spermidine/putrescine transport system substrate-binding protein